MFKTNQVQTLDMAKIIQQVTENHDAKVVVDRLTEFLNREIEETLAAKNDDEKIREDAEKGYDWIYKDLFYGISISGEKLADLIGYKVRPADQVTFEGILNKFRQEKERVRNGE